MRIPLRTKKGFTLIELIVSVGVFTVVMVITSGLLVTTSDVVLKTRGLRNALDNINVTLEAMSIKIRTGIKYQCLNSQVFGNNSGPPRDCTSAINGGNNFTFETNSGNQITYSWNSVNKSIERSIVPIGFPQNYVRITSPEVAIENLTFYVFGAPGTVDQGMGFGFDYEQPFVIISMTGEVKLPGKSRLDTTFSVQTSITHLFDFNDIP